MLDSQLQDAIYQIEHKSGVVVAIKGTDGSKFADHQEAFESKRIPEYWQAFHDDDEELYGQVLGFRRGPV